jgi:hypothetical protein
MTFSVEAWTPPVGAVRDSELEAWEVAERDAGGARHGDCTLYRDDGTVLLRCRYEDGKLSGPFASYHPNGELESEGTYVDGALDGPYRRYTSDKPGSLPLRSCCVPRGARELRATYHRGTPFGDAFFDGAGVALRSDGTPVPERARGVPLDATFEENDECWVHRFAGEGEHTMRRTYALDGRLLEETKSCGAYRVALREFSPEGTAVREHGFDEAGRFHGTCVLRYARGSTPYVDRAITLVCGSYEHGQSVGVWRFFDDAERELRTQDRGRALPDDELEALVVPDGWDARPEALLERSAHLASEGRTREALVVAARAAARAGHAEALLTRLRECAVPLAHEAARASVDAFERSEHPSVRGALDVLLAGGEPSEAFRSLATLVPSGSRLARELVEAAFLLAGSSTRVRVTRALIRLEQGDDQGALADARALGPEFEEVSESIREVARVVFPTFAFTPAFEPPPPPNVEIVPVAVEQPLEAVRRTIAVYATRLGAVRSELVRRFDIVPAWLPPETSRLLTAGPVELRRFTATITDEGEDGSEESEVEIDESLALERMSVAALMIQARAEWDGLCWLCWAAGLDAVALPEQLSARPDFASAVNDAMQRYFRVHDQLRTGGLISRSRGIPSFEWEGLSVELLSGRLAEIVARQYAERRAALLYLVFAENLTPFQSDLRRS